MGAGGCALPTGWECVCCSHRRLFPWRISIPDGELGRSCPVGCCILDRVEIGVLRTPNERINPQQVCEAPSALLIQLGVGRYGCSVRVNR